MFASLVNEERFKETEKELKMNYFQNVYYLSLVRILYIFMLIIDWGVIYLQLLKFIGRTDDKYEQK